MKLTFITLIFLLSILSLKAQTELSGTFTSDTTIQSSLSPYIVHTTITVSTGVTFTIEPGTVIYFDAGTGITVNGNLIANGHENDSIYLLNSSAALWGKITGNSANISIFYTVFKKASEIVYATNGIINIQNSRFVTFCV